MLTSTVNCSLTSTWLMAENLHGPAYLSLKRESLLALSQQLNSIGVEGTKSLNLRLRSLELNRRKLILPLNLRRLRSCSSFRRTSRERTLNTMKEKRRDWSSLRNQWPLSYSTYPELLMRNNARYLSKRSLSTKRTESLISTAMDWPAWKTQTDSQSSLLWLTSQILWLMRIFSILKFRKLTSTWLPSLSYKTQTWTLSNWRDTWSL